MDSVAWSTGQVMLAGGESAPLPPGIHTYQIFSDGAVVLEGSVEIVQLAWSISEVHTDFWDNVGPTISGWAAVPWCGTSAMNYPCCVPEENHTYVRLVQDGTTEIETEYCNGCSNGMPCSGSTVWFGGVPTGHTYHIRVYDSCGNVTDDPNTIVLHSCENLSLTIEEVGTDDTSGEVHLLEAVPDPTEPLPLVGPVAGTAKLYRGLEGNEVVGDVFESVGAASWTGLEAGDYRVEFTPDAGCDRVVQAVQVSSSTSIGTVEQGLGAMLQVGLTADPGRITVRSAQGVATNVEVIDALGRTVPARKLAEGSYHIGAVPPGAYLVRAMVAGMMATAKFIVA